MRVPAFRQWFTSAIHQGVGAARRAGLAISRRIKQAIDKIDVSVGVGDDESGFGSSGSRAWLQVLDEYREKLLQLFEKSYFERFPRFERFVRRLLGAPRAGPEKKAPPLPPPRPTGPLGARPLGGAPSDEAARLRAQLERARMEAHTREGAGLRDQLETSRRKDEEPPG